MHVRMFWVYVLVIMQANTKYLLIFEEKQFLCFVTVVLSV